MFKGKGPVILLVLIVIISLGVIGYTVSLLQNERNKTLSLEAEVETLQKIEAGLKSNLAATTKQLIDIEQQLKDSQVQIFSLTADLDMEKKARQENLTQIDQIKLALEQEQTQKAETESKLGLAQAEITKIQAQLKSVQAQKVDLETKAKELEAKMQRVELGTIVVGEDGMPVADQEQWQPVPGALEGQILVVNKEYNFAVVNLGVKNGVNVNNVFAVYSQGQYIGDIKVEKVHESMSAANFVTPGIKDKILEGDKVVFKNK